MIKSVESLSPRIDSQANVEQFKSAMRRLAASVTVITTGREEELHGMTATAVCSVCAEPPTILVVINRTARSHSLVGAFGFFTVNILARDQQEIAERFSTRSPNQFEDICYIPSKNTKSPIICGAASFLECRLESQFDAGTHTIFIGKVLCCDTLDAEPLLYYDAHYSSLTSGRI